MFLIYSLTILLALSSVSAEIVKTGSGSVEGIEPLSRDGRKYFAFYGIPYADPPVGNLRLKNPLPVNAWEGVKNCKEPAQPCIQVQGFSPKYRNLVSGVEDCLILNIFTPNLNPDKPFAILAQVHGGGFMEGEPAPPYGAGYFMDEDIIIVTIQYRLGALGFLSLEDEILPGNFGLKDQALALAWIKSNIANFGGNPEKITIFGESAGGASSHHHMKSPLSRDLISGAISESGVVNRIWTVAPKDEAKSAALKAANILGCSGSSQEILTCLQNADVEKLVRTRNSFLVWDFNPFTPFKPVIEKKSPGAFLTEDSIKITTNKPWITGITSNEGAFQTGTLTLQDKSVVEDFIANIDSFLPSVLMIINSNSETAKETAKLVKEKYFSKLDYDSVFKGLEQVATDCWFKAPMVAALKTHNGPKYVYLFNYRCANSITDYYGDQPKDLGVAHAEEIYILFNKTNLYHKVKESDVQVSRNVIKMWVNFAQNGIPCPHWKEWKNGEYLLIEETNSMKNALENDWENTEKFWSDLPAFKVQTDTKTEL